MFASRTLLAVLVCTLAAAVSSELPGIRTIVKDVRLRRLHRVPSPSSDANVKIDSLTVDQMLDHFNPFDSRTWKQRYFARADLYKEGGPVFIHIGGEGQEDSSTLQPNGIFMTYLAELYNAKTFDLEHRYYGYSHPTADLTTENLQYLSADQALADLAYFIEYLIEKGDVEKNQKVVVFGGSYPGNLAAWARIKYPHLITAAVSSSAPVFAKADHFEYMQIVGRAIKKKIGDNCYNNVKKATDTVAQLLQTEEGIQMINETFRVGKGLDGKQDIDCFFETLMSPIATATQYDNDKPFASYYNLTSICSFIEGDLTPDEAMEKLAYLVIGQDMYYPNYYDWSYEKTVKDYKRTEYVSSTGTFDPMRPWLYQTCTEFGYYFTFNDSQDIPFPREYLDVAYHVQKCEDLFGSKFQEKILHKGINRSNLEYGGRSPDVTNIVFVNGDIDPWHGLGIMEDVSEQTPAVFVDGGSHCADMNYPNSRYDTESVIAAHQKIRDFVHQALYDNPVSGPVS